MVRAPHPTGGPSDGYRFSQLHIDVARNATDDFNPFHDSVKWRQIQDNPFEGPIALGFQLETLLAESVERRRKEEAGDQAVIEMEYPYRRYSFTFAGVVRAEERVLVDVRPGRIRRGREAKISHRVALRKQGRVVVMGQVQAMAKRPEGLQVPDGLPGDLETLPDGCQTLSGRYFLKNKTLQTSDAKNLLSASQVSPHHYFDELEGRALFPDLFPVSLISSALLEKAVLEGHDLLAQPMVYTSHLFIVDRRLLRQAVSGDRLSILAEGPTLETTKAGRGGETLIQSHYCCLGLLHGKQALFRAEVRLTSLRDLVRVQDGARF
ncbi:MAG TPA: hypothetical protein EYP90_14910 [Chromatiaceae bacterium]|nr:hypothetical protein [Chromatiaceae bacterium]